jgi:hypothetical protein
MIKTCPACKEEFDTADVFPWHGKWCCETCYLSDLDQYLERKWESQNEDDPREDR